MMLYTPEVAKQHNARGDRLRGQLSELVKTKDVNVQFTGIGSMLNMHMRSEPIHNPDDAAKANIDMRELFFFDLIAGGFWLAPRGMIVLSLPITDADCDQLVAAVDAIIDRRRSLLVR